MYCDINRLSQICKEIQGKQLKEIYPDWKHGIIYFRFSDIFGSAVTIVSIKNNYYAGIDILEKIKTEGNDKNE